MFDDIGSALDTASGLLAGGKSTAGESVTGEAAFYKGEQLETPVDGVTDAAAANLENVRDTPEVIEFIHFGYVHLSHTNLFVHPEQPDTEEIKDLPVNSRPRAIQFRSALEREAVLMASFMQSTQAILQERENDKGMLGDAMNALGNLTGLGGGGGSGVTGPADLNPLFQRLKSTASTINISPIGYMETHKAGRDYHQIRADYRALLKKVIKEKPKADPLGGMMGSIPGIGKSVGGPIADIIATAQGIAFKPMDIRVKFYALLADQQEKAIEAACNGMTLAALTPAYTPFLPIWYAKDREKWVAPDAPVQRTEDKSNLLGGVQNEVAGVLEKGRQGAMKGVNAVKDFFELPKTKAPGEPFLSQAFGTQPPDGQTSEPFPMELGDLAGKAFEEALDLKLPGFVRSIVKVIMGISLDLTHGGLQAVLTYPEMSFVDNRDVYESARHRMIQRLINLALDRLAFIKDAKEKSFGGPMGLSIKPGDLADKGLASLEKMVNDKIGTVLNIPLEYAMKGFLMELELARMYGRSSNCLTMECYLGRLPRMQSMLFFNIFFPFWDALMDLAVDLMGKALGGPLAAIQKAAKAAKGAADFARDAKAKADAVADKLKADQERMAGKGIGTGGTGGVGEGYGDALKTKAEEITGPGSQEGQFEFPIQGRLPKGEGKEILLSEWESVKVDHQMDKIQSPGDPAKPVTEPASPPAGGGGMPAIPGL